MPEAKASHIKSIDFFTTEGQAYLNNLTPEEFNQAIDEYKIAHGYEQRFSKLEIEKDKEKLSDVEQAYLKYGYNLLRNVEATISMRLALANKSRNSELTSEPPELKDLVTRQADSLLDTNVCMLPSDNVSFLKTVFSNIERLYSHKQKKTEVITFLNKYAEEEYLAQRHVIANKADQLLALREFNKALAAVEEKRDRLGEHKGNSTSLLKYTVLNLLVDSLKPARDKYVNNLSTEAFCLFKQECKKAFDNQALKKSANKSRWPGAQFFVTSTSQELITKLQQVINKMSSVGAASLAPAPEVRSSDSNTESSSARTSESTGPDTSEFSSSPRPSSSK